MKYNITWLQEKTIEIDAESIEAAEQYANNMVVRLGAEITKVLSIHTIVPTGRKDDKPPTPFGRPPSGTLGGGQMKVQAPLPDAVAA